MGIPLRVIDHPGEGYRFRLKDEGTGAIEAGDMWREPLYDRDGREAWVIVLPSGDIWWTTMGMDQGKPWDVSGTPPCITVSPSIFCSPPTGWHGWIRDGEIVPV